MQRIVEYLWNPLSQVVGLSSKFGVVGLYIFAFTAWMNKAAAIFGLALVLLSCLMEAKLFWKSVRVSPLFWLVVTTGLYILLRTFEVSLVSEPEYSDLHFKDGFRLIYLLGFMLIGWAMADDQKRILVVFTVALAGFVVARLWNFDWSFSTPVPWWKYRTGLGLPAIAFGHYVAVAMIGLLVFAPRFLRQFRSQISRWVAVLLWFLLVLMTLEGVILSQSRFVWASLVLIFPLIAFCARSIFFSFSKIYQALITVTAILFVSSFLMLNWHTVMSRSMAETETYQQVFSGQFEQIQTKHVGGAGKSVGTRIRMLEVGISEWTKSPLFGRGSAAPKILLANSEVPRFSLYNDFHNGIVEILVRYGAIGLTLLTLCLGYTLRSGWKAYRGGTISPDLYLFLMCGMTLLLFSMATNFRMLNSDWRYCLFLFSGALASFELRRSRGL